jgi:enoyl-CoA hydratase/carnithine racemase
MDHARRAVATVERNESVFVLDLGDTENRFNLESLADLNKLLDGIEETEGPKALVISSTGKYWSNGLDLDYMAANPSTAGQVVHEVHALLGRVLTFPAITVAAISGHAFAAGAMLATSADFRVMRGDRGFYCLPEADLGIPFTVAMSELLIGKLPRPAAHEAMTTGKRYGGELARSVGIVDLAVPEEDVLPRSVALAQEQSGKDGRTLATIKRRMYSAAVAALTGPAEEITIP